MYSHFRNIFCANQTRQKLSFLAKYFFFDVFKSSLDRFSHNSIQHRDVIDNLQLFTLQNLQYNFYFDFFNVTRKKDTRRVRNV